MIMNPRKPVHTTICLVASLTLALSLVCVGQVSRPDGWSELSHSKDADPSYNIVFNQDTVQRIDFVISSEDWEAMLADLYENYAFGPGGDMGKGPDPNAQPGDFPTQPMQPVQPMQPNEPPLHIAVCMDKSEGDDAVLIDPKGRVIEGYCAYDDKGTLAFRPDEPAPQDQAFDPGGASPEDHTFGFPNAGGDNPIYVEATCLFGDRVWEHIGIRFKGNSSLRDTAQSGVLKIPFHLEFDHFEDQYPEIDDQRFYGFKDLSLSNGFRDPTLLREKTTNDLFRLAGVPCARSAFYRVYVDHGEGPIYFGLYTMTEIPDDPMLDVLFGNSNGNLYKPEGGSATFAFFDEGAFEKKTNEDEGDWSDVASVIDALNSSNADASAWRTELEAVFDVQGFLRWLAVDTVLGNWDTYGSMPHNFYIYTDEDDGLMKWLPWDNNESLSDWYSPIRSLSLGNVGEEWPLIRLLADDPLYYECYLTYVRETLQSALDVTMLQDSVRQDWLLIQPYVVGADGEQDGYTLLRNDQEFSQGLNQLLSYISRRAQEVESFLHTEGFVETPIVIQEIHYNPSKDQGEDDLYEFVELINVGEIAVSLEGFAFTDGISFTFPASATLEAGQCLVVARDAATYSTLDCPVFEWTDGKLSNAGERLELVDASGVVVDTVTYDDDTPWSEAADGEGASLVVIDPTLPNDLVFDWQASGSVGGSPGSSNE